MPEQQEEPGKRLELELQIKTEQKAVRLAPQGRPVHLVRQRQALPRARPQEDRRGSWSSRTMPWIKRSNVWKQERKDNQEIFTKEQGGKEV